MVVVEVVDEGRERIRDEIREYRRRGIVICNNLLAFLNDFVAPVQPASFAGGPRKGE